GKATLLSLCLLFLIYSLLTLIKSYLFMPIMLFLWGLFVFGRLRVNTIIYVFTLLTPIIYLTFSGLYSSSSEIFYKIFERIFLVQAEGMFLIRQYFQNFELGALLYSSPVRHFSGTETFDPAAEIVKHYFGEGSGWVNMNSFYTGQAFVMFGEAYIFVIPFIFIIQFLFCRSLLKLSLPSGFANVILIGICLFLPLSNNIANLVWFKDLIAVMILLPVLYLLVNTKKVF
ncbi:hypothetical protein, partial [Shewanella sp. Isolate7]|uniref:hypothetical protein n=1 Tax=Shewanella sp. Isolate7 TaxID=2908528 RepID=UPI001EFD25D1